jgi:hypothetical protein
MSIRISRLNAFDILRMQRSTSGWSALPESVQTVQRNLAKRPEEPASNLWSEPQFAWILARIWLFPALTNRTHASTSLLRTAYRTRPAVEFMLSLRMAAARCVSVVFMLRFKIALTPLLLCPSATSLTIVFSRGEST